MRQTEKTHEEGRTHRKHQDVRTPFQRVAASDCVEAQMLHTLQMRFEQLNPFVLREQIDRALDQLFRLPNAETSQTEDIFETLNCTV